MEQPTKLKALILTNTKQKKYFIERLKIREKYIYIYIAVSK